jgi:vitamin B12 transporter
MRPSKTATWFSVSLIFCLIPAFLSNNLWANSPTEESSARQTISGRVLDPSGAPLPQTLLQVRNAQGKLVAATRTNGRGEYSLNLPQGKYSVGATQAGFAPMTDRPLEVPSSTAPVDLTLQIASPRDLVVVTATQTETPLAQLGSSVSVITGEELALKGTFSISDALRETAGISIAQSGGIGKVTSLFLRGGNSNYTKVLIDGIPVNEPGGSYNFANLSSASIDRIEVVRGPQSALYGSDAIAGVVQIFTKRGKSEELSPKPFAMIEGGTFATYRYGGGIEGSNSRMDYAASFSRFDTDNNVANGSFNETSITGNLGLRLSKKLEMRTVFRSEAGRSGVPGLWAFGRPDLDAYYRRRDEAGAVTLSYFQNPSWTQKLAYTINDSMQFSANPLNSGSFTPQYKNLVAPFAYYDWTFQNLNQTRRQKVNYQSDFILPYGHFFSAGADYEHESGEVGDPTLSPAAVTRDNYSGYIQDQWAHKNRLFATAGVRLDHNESFGFFASPRLSFAALARQPGANGALGMTKIKANFGLGIKEPTLMESFSASPYTKGNPDLRPEKTVSFDAGIEQHFNSDRGTLEFTYFQNHFRDQIGYAISDPVTYAGSYFNIGKSRARGLETSLSLDLLWKLSFSGAYTFLDSEVLESTSSFDPVYAEGNELLRRPRHSGNVVLRWKPGRWTFGATAILVGTRADSDFSSLGMTSNKGYTVVNLLANFRLMNDMSLFTAVNNVANEQYMEVLGYPALRRNFRVGLRAGF